MVDRSKVARDGVIAEEDVFGVLLEAKDAIVEDQEHDGQIEPFEGLQLSPGMGEAAVATDADDPGLGRGYRGTNRHRQSPPKAGQAARRDKPLAGTAGGQVIGDPDCGVAGVGDDDVGGFNAVFDLRHHKLWANGAIWVLLQLFDKASPVVDRCGDLFFNCRSRSLALFRREGRQRPGKRRNSQLRISKQAQRLIVAADLHWCNVEMDKPRRG